MTIERQREKLALWLREWNLEKKLSAIEETSDDITELSVTEPPTNDACTDPKPGDVILLPPVGETTFSRPVYMLLIKRTWTGQWQAIPFSRFTVPATDGELATGREFIPLKVLSLWNHGKLDDKVVKRSWRVASMAAADVTTAEEYITGRKRQLPDSRTGAPIVRSFDPRKEYIDEERAIWFDFPTTKADNTLSVHEDSADFLMAAEDNPDNQPPPSSR